MAHYKRTRSNPGTENGGYGVLAHKVKGRNKSLWQDVQDNARESVVDEFYPGSNLEFAAEVALVGVTAMVLGTWALRATVRGTNLFSRPVLGAALVVTGVATREVLPRLSMPLMVGGFSAIWLSIWDKALPFANTDTSDLNQPSGAVGGSASVAQGYWDRRSSINSGTSVVVPL